MSGNRALQLAKVVSSRGFIDLVRNRPAAATYWRCLGACVLECGGQRSFVGKLPRIALEDLVAEPDSIPVTVVDYEYVLGNLGVHELMMLCRIARARKPRRIFEMGTFLGATTLQLAANTDAEITTIDLPPRGHPGYKETVFWGKPDEPGIRFRGSPYAERIDQLVGDLQTDDFSSYFEAIDLVFVDASHKYPYVRKDSETALQMVAPGGTVIWHDYGWHSEGVVQALEEIGERVPLAHVKGTSLVVHCAPERAPRVGMR